MNIIKRFFAFAVAVVCTVTAVGISPEILTSVYSYDEEDYDNQTSFDISDDNYFNMYADTDYITYNGKAQTLNIELYSTETYDTLTENVDYTVTYENNINAGQAKATIQGIGKYTGVRTIDFTIQQANLDECEINFVGNNTYFDYTGKNIKPDVYVSASDNLLVKDSDYTLTYEENCSKPGEYQVIVKGIGNYVNTYNLYYTIEIGNLNGITAEFPKKYTYTGKPVKPVPVIKKGAITLKNGIDYKIISYSNNVNAGIASLRIQGKGNFGDYYYKTINFRIYPKNINKLTATKIPMQNYTGKPVCPKPKVYADGKLLIYGKDYILKYSANKNEGTAACKITTKGNYASKSITVKYIIRFGLINKTVYSSASDRIKIRWSKVPFAQGYKIYKYDSRKRKWIGIKSVNGKTNSYLIKNLSAAQAYKFAVLAYRKVGNKYKYGVKKIISCVTLPQTPTVNICTYKNSAKISWTRNSRSQGYELYRCTGDSIYPFTAADKFYCYSQHKKVKTFGSNRSYCNIGKLSSNKNYHFYVRAYRVINGKKIYSKFSSLKCTVSAESRLNGAKRYAHRTYKTINTQGKYNSVGYHTLTNEEVRILKNFADTHFKKDWSAGKKVVYTAEWIRNHMKYGPIPTGSHTKNIFVYREGQCSDYNGALVEMMTYLGFSPQLIQGNRYPTKGQHFWGEINIGGITYLLEVGEKIYDSPPYYKWEFICQKYSEKSESGKYLKHINGKWILL